MSLKFNRTDKAILLLSITIICVFSYFLYDDSFLFKSRESKNAKIGFIKQTDKDVRLRASDSFTWNAARKTEVVFERDSVFTGKNSHTQIDLIDGSKIILNENSLVTLVTKNGDLELNLRYGNIQAEISPSSKIQLKSGSQKIILKKDSASAKIEIKKPKYGLTKIKLLSGKLSVKQTPSSQPKELVKEQPLVIKPSGIVQKVAPGVITLITADHQIFHQSPTEKTFLLDWHSQGTENNMMTISKDAAFTQVVLTVQNIKSKVLVKDLQPGTYHWKVSGKDATGNTITAGPRSFAVQYPEKPAVIEPVKPDIPILLTKKLTFNSFSSRSPAAISPIAIKWQPSKLATRYEVEMSFKDPKFTKPIKLTSKATVINFVPKTYGPHYFRVRAYGKDDVTSDYSEVGKLNTQLTSPKLNEIQDVLVRGYRPENEAPPATIKIEWSPIYLASKYIVEVSDTKDFKKPETFTVDSNRLNYKVGKPGEFHFRIMASDSSQLQKSKPSNIESSNYTYIKNLAKPVLVEPKNKMTVFLQKETEPFIWLNWVSAIGEKKFELEIALDQKFTKIYAREKLNENKFLIKTRLPLGKVYWRVRQVDADHKYTSEWTEGREFQVIHNKNESVFK